MTSKLTPAKKVSGLAITIILFIFLLNSFVFIICLKATTNFFCLSILFFMRSSVFCYAIFMDLDIAYFSMEIALSDAIPNYSGGLGVLAGDALLTMADFGYKAIGITLLNERGYYSSILNNPWPKESLLKKLPFTLPVKIEGRVVICQVWQYDLVGQFGEKVSVYHLDTNSEQNSEYDRSLTSYLYGGDSRYRLHQEQILGLGGFYLLEKLGFQVEKTRIFHLNEGHAAFFGLALYDWCRQRFLSHESALGFLATRLVFTTHTPLPAGHDRFLKSLVSASLEPRLLKFLPETAFDQDELNMTRLAMFYSGIATSVTRKHRALTKETMPINRSLLTVTNGVHHLRWTSSFLAELYDQYCPLWRRNPAFLRLAGRIPPQRLWQAHQKAKQKLLTWATQKSGVTLNLKHITLGFARRMTSYKRPSLLLSRLDELSRFGYEVGPLQIIFSGKAHASDKEGKVLILKILKKASEYQDSLKIVYLEDYDMDSAAKLVAGVDVWVNTPLRPYEASGTSGMKAALNGVPHFSVLDGWWEEGWVEGVTGWSIGSRLSGIGVEDRSDQDYDEEDLYHKLGSVIMPLYYHQPEQFAKMMINVVSLNGATFTTHRMVNEYVSKIYFPLKNRKRFDEIE